MTKQEKQIEIKHNIKGRLRIKVYKIKNCKEKAYSLRDWLINEIKTESIEVKPLTGNVIIYYDIKRYNANEIINKITFWIKEYSNSSYISTSILNDRNCEKKCHIREKSNLLGNLIHIVFLTGYLLLIFIEKVFLKRYPSQKLTGITGTVALLSALPLLKRTIHDMKENKIFSLFPFLSIGIITAIVLGEAITALEIIWVLRIGMILEDYIAEKSRRLIREIIYSSIKNTYKFENGKEVEIAISEIKVGDTLVIHSGEKIPADGIIINGSAFIDESTITGESIGVKKQINDYVYAGTIVLQGLIFIRVEKVGNDVYISRILYLVEKSLTTRAPVEKKADILSARLMKLGIFLTLITFLVTFDPMKAFSVLLVMSCPCATILAASTAITAAMANAAKRKILIKGGIYLEKISSANCICFDKTGTITAENLFITDIIPVNKKISQKEILSIAATAELHNNHPLARTILQHAIRNNIKLNSHVTCEFIPGKGIKAHIGNDQILVGNDILMKENKIKFNKLESISTKFIENGNIIVYVAKNNKILGLIAIANVLKDNIQSILSRIKKTGINEIYMITGDAETIAASIANTLNLTGYKAKLLPEEKADFIDKLKSNGKTVIMVGDGVNDALALSKADIGISIGTSGAEAAMEASDICLADGKLENLVFLRNLSKKTLKTIEENHFLALLTNFIGVLLGITGIINPFIGGLLHVAHTGLILLNSFRLTNLNPDETI